jgi:hypothetical protein
MSEAERIYHRKCVSLVYRRARLTSIYAATLWTARLLTGCFVAHRSKTTAGILPLRFAHPAKIRSSATTPATDLVHQDVVSEIRPGPGSRASPLRTHLTTFQTNYHYA